MFFVNHSTMQRLIFSLLSTALAGEADFKTKMTVFQQDKDHLKVVNSVNHALPAAFVQTNAKPEVVLGPKSQITSPEGTKVAASAVSFARLDPSKFPRDLDVEEDTLGCIFKGTLFQHGANVSLSFVFREKKDLNFNTDHYDTYQSHDYLLSGFHIGGIM